MPPHLPMKVSVALPPALMAGLSDNYLTVFGKRASFPKLAIYALEGLWVDLANEAKLASAGIFLPEFDPSYTIGLKSNNRLTANGYFTLKIPEEFRSQWGDLLRAHHYRGPAIVHRAMLSLYRTTRNYYVENEKDSYFLKKYPAL